MYPHQSPESAILFLGCSRIYENRRFSQLDITEGTSSELRQAQVQISTLLCDLEESLQLSSEPIS